MALGTARRNISAALVVARENLGLDVVTNRLIVAIIGLIVLIPTAREDGLMHNLNDLIPTGTGWDLLSAADINDDGRIVGVDISPGGDFRAFLLVPDEPNASVSQMAVKKPFVLRASPNPFHIATSISYTLPDPGHVRVTVYDVAGRQVATLRDGLQLAGHHTLAWDPTTRERVAPGLWMDRGRQGLSPDFAPMPAAHFRSCERGGMQAPWRAPWRATRPR